MLPSKPKEAYLILGILSFEGIDSSDHRTFKTVNVRPLKCLQGLSSVLWSTSILLEPPGQLSFLVYLVSLT
jgi:hypothetical protein